MIAAALGWIGTIGTIGAYVLLTRGTFGATSIRYSALNGLGGVLGAVGSSAVGAWPSVASNLLWAAIAGQTILLTLRARRGQLAPVVELREPVGDPEPPTGPIPVVSAA
jgi:hypothetical protein